MTDPIADLKRAETHYRSAVENAVEARAIRDDAIRACARAGISHADIYRALGETITRARIGQIASEKEENDGS